MSIRQENKVIAGHINYHPDLFDHKWADHLLNNVSWLRADTFSWQDGSVYEAAYDHLEADITGKSLSSETVGGVTVQFYLADDGHKICPASEESNVASIYSATGAAWYYIIDTINERFKLPRNKHEHYGDRPVVGNGMTLGLTDGTTNAGLLYNINNKLSAYTGVYGQPCGTTYSGSSSGSEKGAGVTTDATKSGIISTPVQDTDQYKYLYFYVGNFTQTALENTAGLNASLFNGKADLNLLNTANNVDFVIERQEPNAGNNYTWYRKYKSGWVEQGGQFGGDGAGGITKTLPIEMADINYEVIVSANVSDGTFFGTAYKNSTTQITVWTTNYLGGMTRQAGSHWRVSGMAA